MNNPKIPIKPLSRDREFANEYGDFIMDYSKEKSHLSLRLIPPYVTSKTHGSSVFDGVLNIIDKLKPKSILDLGCGAGELLFLSKKFDFIQDRHGCTIHIGEINYAKENYELYDIYPLDMREVDIHLPHDYYDLIITHCSLHFINYEERQQVIDGAYKLLKTNGCFIVVDYKNKENTGISGLNTSQYQDISNQFSEKTMGKLTVLQKC